MSAITSSHLMSVIRTPLDISVICGTLRITLRLRWNARCWHVLWCHIKQNPMQMHCWPIHYNIFFGEILWLIFKHKTHISGRGLNRFRWGFALWIHFVQFWIRRFIRGKSGRLVEGKNCVRFLWIRSIWWLSGLDFAKFRQCHAIFQVKNSNSLLGFLMKGAYRFI